MPPRLAPGATREDSPGLPVGLSASACMASRSICGVGAGGKGELADVDRKGSHLPACWLAPQVGGDREGRRRGSGAGGVS